MILPKTNHAAQQIGSPQKRTVAGSRAADHDVVSAAGANVPPVDHEFFAAKPGLPRFLVKHRRILHEFVPIVRGLQIHLDDSGSRFQVTNLVQRWREFTRLRKKRQGQHFNESVLALVRPVFRQGKFGYSLAASFTSPQRCTFRPSSAIAAALMRAARFACASFGA